MYGCLVALRSAPLIGDVGMVETTGFGDPVEGNQDIQNSSTPGGDSAEHLFLKRDRIARLLFEGFCPA